MGGTCWITPRNASRAASTSSRVTAEASAVAVIVPSEVVGVGRLAEADAGVVALHAIDEGGP